MDRPPPRRSLILDLLPGTLAICRLEQGAAIPPWASEEGFLSITRSEGELTIVLPDGAVPAGILCERGWRRLRVQGPLEFSEVGHLASLTTPLAGAGVSIYVISTYDTDHLLVKETQLEAVLEAMRSGGHQVEDS